MMIFSCCNQLLSDGSAPQYCLDHQRCLLPKAHQQGFITSVFVISFHVKVKGIPPVSVCVQSATRAWMSPLIEIPKTVSMKELHMAPRDSVRRKVRRSLEEPSNTADHDNPCGSKPA
eukprot:4694285-Amphidinium_carterae.1